VKADLLFGEPFPSGSGNPRCLRISSDAPFPQGQIAMIASPMDFTNAPRYLPTYFADDPRFDF
jgi:hypothetical protein